MFLVLNVTLFLQTLIKSQRTETMLRTELLTGFSHYSLSQILKYLLLDQARSSEKYIPQLNPTLPPTENALLNYIIV